MNAPSPAPFPPPARETELARAETELASQEARLAEQLSQAIAEAETLSLRLNELRQEVMRVPPERQGDESVRGTSTRLESASLHTRGTEDARGRALAARHEALEARRRSTQETRAALERLQLLNSRTQQELAEAAAGLKRSAEAAARAQREREAARARPPAASQANLTLPEPRPLGARASRVRIQTQIDQRSDSNFFTGFSTHVSEGGIFVATVQTVPRGTTVDLDVTLPGGRPLKVTGVVNWTREVNDKTPELMPGLGVKFTHLPPEVAAAVSDFVATREPLFFPD